MTSVVPPYYSYFRFVVPLSPWFVSDIAVFCRSVYKFGCQTIKKGRRIPHTLAIRAIVNGKEENEKLSFLFGAHAMISDEGKWEFNMADHRMQRTLKEQKLLVLLMTLLDKEEYKPSNAP